MKKTLLVITLAMVVSLSFCLFGCGNTQLSQSEVDSAQDFNSSEYFQTVISNVARAKQNYEGKIFKVDGHVSAIESDHILLNTQGDHNPVYVPLPQDVIAKMTNRQHITFVGKLFSVENSYGFTEFHNITNLEFGARV